MKQHTKIVLFLIPITAYFIFITYYDGQKILYNVTQVKINLFLIFVAFWSLAVVCRTVRWHIFMMKVTNGIPFIRNVFYYLSGYSMLLSPGRVGEVIKSPFIKRDYNVSISKTSTITFVERFYDILASITIIGLAISFTSLPRTALVIPIGIIVIMILVMLNKKIFIIITVKLDKIRIVRNLIPNVDESFEVIFSLIKFRSFLIGSGITLCAVLFEAISVYFLLESFGITTFDFATLTAIFHISNFVAAASMVPGGFGILEGGFSGLLIFYKIPNDISFSVSVLLRLIATGLFTVIGLICLRIVSKLK